MRIDCIVGPSSPQQASQDARHRVVERHDRGASKKKYERDLPMPPASPYLGDHPRRGHEGDPFVRKELRQRHHYAISVLEGDEGASVEHDTRCLLQAAPRRELRFVRRLNMPSARRMSP